MAPADEQCWKAAIKDHTGEEVSLVWHKQRASDRDTIPPFPFQVYILRSARECYVTPEEVGKSLCLSLEENAVIPRPNFRIQIDSECQHRVEIYRSTKFTNVLSCVGHQRKEVDWRNRNGIWPRLVSAWDHDTCRRVEQYQGLIVVIDSDNWREEGLLLVSFDPARYETTRRDPRTWYLAGNEPAIVRATRKFVQHRPYQETLQGALSYAWQCAGGVWTQRDLARRNDGGFSPALYPAVDPAAHEDIDAGSEEDDNALPSASLAMTELDQQDADDGDDDDDLPLIRETFSKDDLWMLPTAYTPRYRTATYSDTSDLHTISVWSKERSSTRPTFVFTLYCGFKAVFAAEALFHCLNKGLMAGVPWTLDVKRGFDTTSEALEHHENEKARRTEQRVQKRRHCMSMILDKINDKRLPVELLDYILEVLVPPALPDYFGYPNRPFNDVFLYFNPVQASQQAFAAAHGPLLVYSQPSSPYDDYLLVRFLRFWHRVSDEMFTIWSLAAPRATDMQRLPKLKLCPLNIETQFSVRKPPEAMHDPDVSGPVDILHPQTYSLVYQSSENDVRDAKPIIISTTATAIGSTPCSPFEIVDASTNTPLPPGQAMRYSPDLEGQWWQDSWSHCRSLGFRKPLPGIYSESYPCSQLDPGSSSEEAPWPSRLHVGWREEWPAGTLVPGREYILRLRPGGFVVPRWTFGTLDDLQKGRAGPFNLPPLQVEMNEVRFVCQEWIDLDKAG